jgi:hypothetical protein
MRLLEQFSSTGFRADDPRDRNFESRVYRASGLNLLIAAIICHPVNPLSAGGVC